MTDRTAFPILSVRDLPRCVAFYVDLLGFERGYRWPPEGDPEFVVVRVGESSVGLAAVPDAHGENSRFELCVYVEDVDSIVAELRAHDVPVLQEPQDMPWGERMAYVADPDGNRVHLAARGAV